VRRPKSGFTLIRATPPSTVGLEAASRLYSAARLRANGNLDAAAMRQHAPFAPYINTNARVCVSQNVGVFNYSNINQSTNLVATALR
jgi:hypothetical protein